MTRVCMCVCIYMLRQVRETLRQSQDRRGHQEAAHRWVCLDAALALSFSDGVRCRVCGLCAVSASMVASAAKNVMVPMRRKVVMVREDASAAADMNKNAYYREYDANKADVETIKLLYKSAAIVQKFARRKLVPQRCLSCHLTLALSHSHAHAPRSIWKRRGCDGRPRRRRSCGASSSSSRPGSRSGETASSIKRPARCYGFRCLLPFHLVPHHSTPLHPTSP